MTNANQNCQPYMTVSADRPDHAQMVAGAVFERASIPCLLLTAPSTGSYDISAAGNIMELCRAHDAAFLIENDIGTAVELGADGVHIIADAATYNEARARLGADIQIGVACGNSRHQAMQFAENGADYIAFGDTQSDITSQAHDRETIRMIAWWSDLFEIPCVAWCARDGDAARRCIENGADFIALAGEHWIEGDQMAADMDALFAISPPANNGRDQ